jgi:hypothetical protein
VKKGNRIPKSAVEELLEKRGLSMERRTLGKKRAWVVSDGKAFPTLKSVYAFYYHEDTERQRGISTLLDKVLNKEE